MAEITITINKHVVGGFLVGALLVSGIFGGVSLAKKLNNGEAAKAGKLTQEAVAPAPNPAPVKAVFNINPKVDHIRGNVDASVTLVEFSDFQCPYCARHQTTLNEIVKKYAGKVRLVHKHFPLSFHQFAKTAALASECAAEQNKFWEYTDELYLNQAKFSDSYFKEAAAKFGLDIPKFNKCLADEKYASRVDADFAEGTQKGVEGTPATFVNGELIVGAVPISELEVLIQKVLGNK